MISDRFQSLAARLSLWIISLGTIIFITVLSTNYFLSRLLLQEYASELAKTTASSTVQKIEAVFHIIASDTDSLASVISTSEITEKQIHQTLKAFLNSNKDIFGMTVALEPNTLIISASDFSPYYYRKAGKIVYTDLANDTYQYKNRSWYSEPKKSNSPVWSEPYLDTGGGNVSMITYSTPIYSDNSTFAGIATADIELSWLDKIVKEIKIGDSGYGFIVSKDDTVVSHPDTSLNMKKLIDTLDQKIIPDNWQQYIDSKSKSASVYLYTPCRDRDGYCWAAIESLGDTGWKVIIVLPEQELISQIRALTIKIAIIAVAGLLLLLIAISLISRHLTSPLNKLAAATRDIGAGHLDTKLPEPVRADEIGELTKDFSSMRDALKTYITEIQEATAKQQKLDSEMQIAKDIQMSMIPGAGNISSKQDCFHLFALLRPARSVGGDLYYYQECDDKLYFIIGDVSDKGIPAALFMAKTVTLYSRALKEMLSPGQTFTMMNDLLEQNNDACMFVTALCGVLDLKTGKTIMANAGHMDPITKNTHHAREKTINGATALGLMNGVEYPDIEFQLDSGTSLIMYTDGISEAHNTESQQYGDQRLLNLINATHSADTEVIGNMIINDVDDFSADTEQFDDITLLIIHYD